MSAFPVSSATFSSIPSSPITNDISSKEQDVRNTMYINTSIWGDQFLKYVENEADVVVEKQLIEELKKEVRKELIMIKTGSTNETMQHMKLIELIDAVQRLGLSYHFEVEIEKALKQIYNTYGDTLIHNHNLETTSLYFRLLRQQGFNISSGIFTNNIDEKGNFKECFCNDAQGMLALYEAAYMRVEGEQVLDDALEFTKIHLGMIAKDPSCDTSLRTQIQAALKQPLRKRLTRLEAVRYAPLYQQQPTHNEILLKLAKLDFNFLQSMHKRELSQICRWWKDLDIKNKLPYVRDRLIEGFFWILGIYFEPQHSSLRIFLMKTCMWLVVIDDTFDNYGAYEELEIFTQSIEKWSISCLDELPEYMKMIYQELLNFHLEMEESLEKDGKAYKVHYVIETAKEWIRSLLIEAKWVKDGYTPTLEEYLSNSLITCANSVIIARSFLCGSDMVIENSFKWLATHPPLVKASCLILRLMNDVTGHKEQQRCHVASSIECYQKETGASKKEAYEFFSKQVEDAWKVINQESLKPTHVPFPQVMTIINSARVSDAFYKGNDGFNHAGKKVITYIESLVIHPILA